MLTINSDWKAAFNQAGVAPIIHIKILDLDTFTDSSVSYVSGNDFITCTTTAALAEGMTVSGTGIPDGSYIVGIKHPASYGAGTATMAQISETIPASGSTTATFGKVYQMATQRVNRGYGSDRTPADPIVLNIVPVAVSMDPLTRSPQVSELNVEIADDGTFRRLIRALYFKMKRKKVEVRVGAPHLDFVNYEKIFTGELFSILPSDGIITLKLRDTWQAVTDGTTRRHWMNEHPLQVIQQTLIESGTVTASDLDTNSFDPDHSSNADIGHYCLTSFSTFAGDRPQTGTNIVRRSMTQFDSDMAAGSPGTNWGTHSVPLKPILDELTRGMYGFIYANPQGKLVFKRYDSTAAAVRHFTLDDYSDFRQNTSQEDVINDVRVKIGYTNRVQEFRMLNAVSVAEYGYYEMDLGKNPHSATNTFVYLTWGDPSFSAIDNEVVVFSGQTNGLSGTRGFASATVAGANAAVSAARPLILLNGRGFLKCLSVDEANGTSIPHREVWQPEHYDPYNTQPDYKTGPDIAKLSSLTHGFEGTATPVIELSRRAFAADQGWHYTNDTEALPQWWREPLWDITMLYDYAHKILQRYQNGLPTIQFTAPLSHFDLELGDFITIDASEFLHRNTDGLDNGTKWEIIGKESSFFGSTLGIQFSCAMVNEESVSIAPILPTFPAMSFMEPTRESGDSRGSNTASGNSVVSGFKASASASAGKIDVKAGSCCVGGVTLRLNPFTSPTLPASRDCYVGISDSGSPVVATSSNGGDPPSIGPNEVRIWKVVTGEDSVVSSLSDLRSFGATTGGNVDLDLNIHNELLPNGGFSAWTLGPTDSPDCWHLGDTSGTFQRGWKQDLDSRTGNFTLTSKGGVAYASSVVSSLFPVEPNTPYTVSVWVKGSSVDTCNFQLNQFTDRTAAPTVSDDFGKASFVPLGTSDYVKKTFETVTGGTVKYAHVRLMRPAAGGGINGDDMHFNSVEMVRSPLRFKATATVDQTIPTNSTALISFGTELFDYVGIYDHTVGKFIAVVPGVYSFTVSIMYRSPAGTGIVSGFIDLLSDGVAEARAKIPTVVSNVPQNITLNAKGIYLDKGMTVNVRGIVSGGLGDDLEIIGSSLANSCVFEGSKID